MSNQTISSKLGVLRQWSSTARMVRESPLLTSINSQGPVPTDCCNAPSSPTESKCFLLWKAEAEPVGDLLRQVISGVGLGRVNCTVWLSIFSNAQASQVKMRRMWPPAEWVVPSIETRSKEKMKSSASSRPQSPCPVCHWALSGRWKV